MKNKNLFLLSFFSLLPAATQCMESIQEIMVAKPKTMQDIRDDRDAIYKERTESDSFYISPLDNILFQENWSSNLSTLKVLHAKNEFCYKIEDEDDEEDENEFCLSVLGSSIVFKERGYSFLGLATIAKKEIISSRKPSLVSFKKEDNRLKNIFNKENKNSTQVSFAEAKEHIKQLLALSFGPPTEKDIYFHLLAKYEEFWPLIIKKICTFQHAPLLTEIEIPEEINPYIALLMFNAEESLL